MNNVIFKINGKTVSKSKFRRHRTRIANNVGKISHVQSYSDTRPGKSLGMGCHPKQVGLLNETIKKHGVRGVEYRVNERGRGECVITSREGRAKWMPIFGNMHGIPGLHDDDGGYSDG